ncbi:MAG: restriction endonuclease [Clostridia bacterium]|nr:restriction endonuclease [Clostridia bacterium]
MTQQQLRQMEKLFIQLLGAKASTKKQAIDEALSHFDLTPSELRESRTNGKKNILKSQLGEVFAGLCQRGILIADKKGVYTLAKTRPVILREEKCEAALLAALKSGGKTRKELRAILTAQFGTDRTVSTRDDSQLAAILSSLLSRLTKSGVLLYEKEIYSICEKCTAEPTNLFELAKLRAEYLALVHSKGGEFFEHYFMNLLERYVTLHHKTVLENTSVGGSEDGGIDGVLKTRDCLGFEETVLVQTKNRHMTFSEREMRGFYGAVRAKMGSRGIFATSGTFHEGATKFLDSLPDLVGVDGYRLFEMATETLYGIKKSGGKLTVDTKVIS